MGGTALIAAVKYVCGGRGSEKGRGVCVCVGCVCGCDCVGVGVIVWMGVIAWVRECVGGTALIA